MKTLLIFVIAAFCGRLLPAQTSSRLSLQEYLNQVSSRNEAVLAAKKTSTGARQRAEEATLVYSPTLFANAQFLSDAKPTINQALMGDQTRFDTYSFGVSEQTDFGMQAKLSYNVGYTSIYGVSPQFVPTANFADAEPLLEITQSLWRNGFGKETRALVETQEAQALASHHTENYKDKLLLLQAEQAYWRLALARETVRVQKETLDRASRIKDYSQKRVEKELADKADLLQAEANYESRRLDLQQAIDEENSAARDFNTLLQADRDEVDSELVDFRPEAMEAIKPPPREALREDTKAAKELERAAVAMYDAFIQKTSPTLDVFGSLGLNGRDPGVAAAAGDSFSTDHPTVVAGIRFSLPLDFGLISTSRDGALKEKEGAELNYRRKLFEQDREWHELDKKLGEAKARLELSVKIEVVQNQKLKREKERLETGRSTTYQVILFEQDFAVAQFARIRTQAEILKIMAQMKTFGGEA